MPASDGPSGAHPTGQGGAGSGAHSPAEHDSLLTVRAQSAAPAVEVIGQPGEHEPPARPHPVLCGGSTGSGGGIAGDRVWAARVERAQKGGSSVATPTGVAQGSAEPPRPAAA